ncbi:MAG: hypothetical protein V1807_01475 [Patescibacteria group bacterium]
MIDGSKQPTSELRNRYLEVIDKMTIEEIEKQERSFETKIDQIYRDLDVAGTPKAGTFRRSMDY